MLFRLGLHPKPVGELSAPQAPYLVLIVLLNKRRARKEEGKEKKGRNREYRKRMKKGWEG